MSSCTTSTAHSCLCAAEPESSCVCLCAHHTWYAHLDGCLCAECTACTTGGSTTACATTTTTDCIDAIDEIVSTLPACPTVSTLADVVLAVRTACSGVVTTSAAYDAVYDRVSNRQVNNVNLYVHEAYALLVQGGPALPIFTYCGSIEALHTETDLYELHAFCHALYQYADVVRGINTLDRNAIRYAQQTNQTSHDRVRTRLHQLLPSASLLSDTSCADATEWSSTHVHHHHHYYHHHHTVCPPPPPTASSTHGCRRRSRSSLSWQDRREYDALREQQQQLEDEAERLTTAATAADQLRDAIAHVMNAYESARMLVQAAIASTVIDTNGQIVSDASFSTFQQELSTVFIDLRNFMQEQTYAGKALLQGAAPAPFYYRRVAATASRCACDPQIAALALARAEVSTLEDVLTLCDPCLTRRMLLHLRATRTLSAPCACG